MKSLEASKIGLTASGIISKTSLGYQYVFAACRTMRLAKNPLIEIEGGLEIRSGKVSSRQVYLLTKDGFQFLKDYVHEETKVELRYKAILKKISDGKKYSSKELAKLLSVGGAVMSSDCSAMYDCGLIGREKIESTLLGAINTGSLQYNYFILEKGKEKLAGTPPKESPSNSMKKKIETPFALGAMFGSHCS